MRRARAHWLLQSIGSEIHIFKIANVIVKAKCLRQMGCMYFSCAQLARLDDRKSFSISIANVHNRCIFAYDVIGIYNIGYCYHCKIQRKSKIHKSDPNYNLYILHNIVHLVHSTEHVYLNNIMWKTREQKIVSHKTIFIVYNI